MADVRIQVGATPTIDATNQARLICGAITVTLPWWPDEIAWNTMAYSWTEQPRPGRAPLLLQEARTLPEISIGFVLAFKPTNFVFDAPSIQPTINDLRAIATSETPTQLMLAARDTGRWRITDFAITELDHAPEGSPIRADVSMTLKRAQDAAAPIGPVPARKKKRKSGRRA